MSVSDADVLDAVKAIRDVCTRVADGVASHSGAEVHTDHAMTDCTEGASRLVPAFVHIAHVATCLATDLSADLAEAVRDLLTEILDREENDNDD